MMRLYKTRAGAVVERDGAFFQVSGHTWDALINHEDLDDVLRAASTPATTPEPLAPLGGQEVWAAGVTYFRSRTARMDEVKAVTGGAGEFYDRVYSAERPELFFKATPHRVSGPEQAVRVRRDSRWNIPEPELTLVVNARAEIIGCTIGNDLCSRDIEGENPLYLPQAKVYDGSCAIGPAILLTGGTLDPATEIGLEVLRAGMSILAETTTLSQMKRDPQQLVEFLYRECTFPAGCLLMTGTGIVPPDDFTLQTGDVIRITVPPIGVLTNTVAP